MYGVKGGTYRVLVEDLMKRDHLDDLGIEGRGSARSEMGRHGLDRWRAVVNARTSIRVP